MQHHSNGRGGSTKVVSDRKQADKRMIAPKYHQEYISAAPACRREGKDPVNSMAFSLKDINYRTVADPAEFMAECDRDTPEDPFRGGYDNAESQA